MSSVAGKDQKKKTWGITSGAVGRSSKKGKKGSLKHYSTEKRGEIYRRHKNRDSANKSGGRRSAM